MYSHLIIFSKEPLTFPEEESSVDGNISCTQIMMFKLNKCCTWSFRKGRCIYKLNCMNNLVFEEGADCCEQLFLNTELQHYTCLYKQGHEHTIFHS